jgi:DNA-directed RNA polymerase specialized sigma24 family protein
LPIILRHRYALPCADIALILNKRKSTIYQQLREGRRELEKMAQQCELRDSSPALKEVPGLE